MAVLDVGRIHAVYRKADAASAERFDQALSVLAAEAMTGEVTARVLPRAHAVCLRSLDVPVVLDPGLPTAALSRAWACAILDALVERLATADDVAVYEHETDLLVEVVRLVAAGDHSRLWAWRQTGVVDLWSPWPGAAEVSALLERRPLLVPGVLRAARSAVVSVLDVDGWLAVARSFRAAVGASAVDGAGRVEPTGIPSGVSDDRRHMPAGHLRRSVDAARSIVPEDVWASVEGDVAVDLAILVLACTAPALSRDPTAVALVTAAAARPGAPERRDRPPLGATGSATAADEAQDTSAGDDVAEPDRTRRSRGRTDERAPETGEESAILRPDLVPVFTRDGGVLYLVHGVSALELAPEASSWDALARVLSAVTGVATDDPAVLAAAGAPAEPRLDLLRAALDDDRADMIDALAARLDDWIRQRLDDDGDLSWVWRRRASIEIEPGGIEVTFDLADVDLRLRRAGLDLDPGYVWWLGTAMRFRNV